MTVGFLADAGAYVYQARSASTEQGQDSVSWGEDGVYSTVCPPVVTFYISEYSTECDSFSFYLIL